jgi:hypothetical protein
MKTGVLMLRALYDARVFFRRLSMDCHDKGGQHAIVPGDCHQA